MSRAPSSTPDAPKAAWLSSLWLRALGSMGGAMGLIFAAKIVAAGAAFLATALAGRFMGSAAFGQLAVLLNFMRVLAGIGGPALDTTFVRFTARHDAETGGAGSCLRPIAAAKGLAMLLVVAVSALLARPLAMRWFGGAGAGWIMLAGLGACGLMAFEFMRAWLQAHQRFTGFAASEAAMAVGRLAVVGGLAFGGAAHLTWILGAYVAAPLAAAVVLLVLLAGGLACEWRKSMKTGQLGALAGFAKWVVLACLFTSIAQGLDLLMLPMFGLPDKAVGDYGAARTLMIAGDLVVLSLFSVLLPAASREIDPAKLRALLHRYTWPTVLCAAALLPGLFLAGPIAWLTFGPDYTQTGGLFAVLLVGTLFNLASAPAGTVLYGLGHPHVIAGLEGLKLALTFAAALWATAQFGAYGMAWTIAAVKGTIGLVTYGAARRALRTGPACEGSGSTSGRTS